MCSGQQGCLNPGGGGNLLEHMHQPHTVETADTHPHLILLLRLLYTHHLREFGLLLKQTDHIMGLAER